VGTRSEREKKSNLGIEHMNWTQERQGFTRGGVGKEYLKGRGDKKDRGGRGVHKSPQFWE